MTPPEFEDLETYDPIDEKTKKPIKGSIAPGTVAEAPGSDEDSFALQETETSLEDDADPSEVLDAEEVFPEGSGDRLTVPLPTAADYAIVFELIPHAESLVDKATRDAAVREYVDLVTVHRIPPQIAANRVGRGISQSPFAKSVLTKLLTDFHSTSAIDREFVRAGRRQIAVQALYEGDRKNALAALKAIASDPDVGLDAPPVTNIIMDIADLGGLLDTVSKMKLLDVPKELQDNQNEPNAKE